MAAQIIAVFIFIGMFILIITEKFERHVVTLVSGAAMLLLVFGVCMHNLQAAWDTINLASIFQPGFWMEVGATEIERGGINWETILFIAGMMIMVEGMALSGFFRWLCITIAKAVHYRVIPIFITFMLMSAILAMFIDSITVILFLAAVTVELAQLLKFDPIPMIITEIFCANLGGSATMCGDPPNIIIGTSLKLTFFDFITNTGVIAAISLVVVICYFYLVFRKELTASSKAQVINESTCPRPKDAIVNQAGFIMSVIIFLCAVILLVTHARTGFSVALIGVGVAVVTLLSSGRNALSILKRVDYKTLLFFIGLFMVVGGLEQTGILEIIAYGIEAASGGSVHKMTAIIMWVSAMASAFVDNIPFAATMIPVVKVLSESSGVNILILAWALSMGTDIGGCATPIGASANVVGISVSSNAGYPIGWGKYCKTAIPATVIVLVISMICIWVRYL